MMEVMPGQRKLISTCYSLGDFLKYYLYQMRGIRVYSVLQCLSLLKTKMVILYSMLQEVIFKLNKLKFGSTRNNLTESKLGRNFQT